MALHPLTEADLELILPWRNALAVRRAMYSHHEIAPDEHRAWFRRMRQDPSARWYLYRNAAGAPMGVVYFTGLDPIQKTATWGFYTNPKATPGAGTRILYAALELAFGELDLHKLNGEALASNATSVNLHKKLGFTQEGIFRDQYFDGAGYVDVMRFGMVADEWRQQRDRLRARVAELDALAARRQSAPPVKRIILILSDAQSWINACVEDLVIDWGELGHQVSWSHRTEGLPAAADFCFCMSFSKIVSGNLRARFRHTLVVHESDLPRGKGWSPLTWRILEGHNHIPVTLFEAQDRVDSGAIYAQSWLDFQGNELIDEMRGAQAEATLELCRWFVDDYPASAERSRAQTGAESFYPRRRPNDSRLDPDKSIADQFDLLRVVDNARYPAFFDWRGQRYEMTIRKA